MRPGLGCARGGAGGFTGKQLEELKHALPKATRIAVLLNPTNEVTNALIASEAPQRRGRWWFGADCSDGRRK